MPSPKAMFTVIAAALGLAATPVAAAPKDTPTDRLARHSGAAAVRIKDMNRSIDEITAASPKPDKNMCDMMNMMYSSNEASAKMVDPQGQNAKMTEDLSSAKAKIEKKCGPIQP